MESRKNDIGSDIFRRKLEPNWHDQTMTNTKGKLGETNNQKPMGSEFK